MVLFFIVISNCYSQHVLKGNIKDFDSNKGVAAVNVLVKTIDGSLINFAESNEDGFYEVELSNDIKKIVIETSIISHIVESKTLNFLGDTEQVYIRDFILKKRINKIEEVYIVGKRPISLKKDTTVYNINRFKDGSERVVEDILRKLPGISISDNGKINFKGKQVISLLLDGDDIFNSNYTIGTKNIDSEIIEAVEAIEDYNKNPLLKGVKTSNDVAVNLILKKGKTDISGNAEIGLGIKDRTYLNTNLISVSKKTKGFFILSHNNVGENNSPFNFISNSVDISKAGEIDKRTANLATSNNFNSILMDERVRINNNYFGSLNALYKIDNKSSLKLNYSSFYDSLKRRESYSTTYKIDNSNINIYNETSYSKTPSINIFDFEYLNRLNKKSYFTFSSKYDIQNIENSAIGFNNDDFFNNTTNSKDSFLNSNIEYTYKINKGKALQLNTNFSFNNIPQYVTVKSNSQDLNQVVQSKKTTFNFKTTYLSSAVNNETTITMGYDFKEDNLNSQLSGINVGQSTNNDIYYKLTKPFANFSFNINYKKWQFITSLDNELVNVNINDLNTKKNNTTVFAVKPYVSIDYNLNKIASFYGNYKLSNNLPNISNVYSGLVLTDNRTLINNSFEFNLFNYQSSTIGYRINDFYNLFQFNISVNYNFNKYGYINELNVSEDRDFYTQIVSVSNNKRFYLNLNFEKYIHFLRSTLNIKSNYSIRDYQSIINNSGIVNNTNKSFNAKFGIRTGFKSGFNVENKLTLSNNIFENNISGSFSNTSLQNNFKIKYIKNRFQFVLDSEYYNSNLTQVGLSDFFLDGSMIYKSKNEKFEYRLNAINIFNNKTYSNLNVSDFSESLFIQNLQERSLLFTAKFRF